MKEHYIFCWRYLALRATYKDTLTDSILYSWVCKCSVQSGTMASLPHSQVGYGVKELKCTISNTIELLLSLSHACCNMRRIAPGCVCALRISNDSFDHTTQCDELLKGVLGMWSCRCVECINRIHCRNHALTFYM